MGDQEIRISEKREVTPAKGELTYEGLYFTPAVDIYESPTELVLVADMPGVEPEDLDIDLNDDTLSIVGKVAESPLEGEVLLAEYRLGSYFRSFALTDALDQGKISASLADGVLRIVLPKAAKAVPRKIPIATQ